MLDIGSSRDGYKRICQTQSQWRIFRIGTPIAAIIGRVRLPSSSSTRNRLQVDPGRQSQLEKSGVAQRPSDLWLLGNGSAGRSKPAEECRGGVFRDIPVYTALALEAHGWIE